jgi:hypothetical protein
LRCTIAPNRADKKGGNLFISVPFGVERMRRSIAGLLSLVAGSGLLLGAQSADAWPWSRAPAPTEGPVAFAPYTSRYVVVSPTPPGGQAPPSNGCAPWTANRVAAPNYPWGWFGGGAPNQNWTHKSYYGEYRDNALMREE